MTGKVGIVGVVLILAFSAGCTMCCHPYDNCGPVFDASSGHPYCSNLRAGSILENRPGPVEPATSQGTVEESEESVSLSLTAPQQQDAESESPRLLDANPKTNKTATLSKRPKVQ